MAETQVYSINIQGDGDVVITDEVVSVIAGLAALETEGVNSLVGGIVSDNISKAGSGKLAKSIRVIQLDADSVAVRMAVNLSYGYEIPKVSASLQEKVKSAIESMTGLSVAGVDVRIAAVIQ